MVVADSHLKLLPIILGIYTMFEYIDMLSIGIWWQLYTVTPPVIGSDYGVLGHLWCQNDALTSWLRVTDTSNCFPDPYYTYTQCLSTFICCP